MASIHKLPSGLWRVQIARRGVRMSQTFSTKAAASMWAAREEASILDGAASKWPRKTLADALDRYEREITPSKGGRVFEGVALGLTRRENPELCAKIMHTINAQDLYAWRDKRLQSVSGSTVIRYAALLRNIWTVAAREWAWVPTENPWTGLKLPQHNPARDRLLGWREIRAQLRRLNYTTGIPPASKMQQTAHAWLLALRTGMRASEVLRLSPGAVQGRVVTLHEHKTRHITGRARHVPVTAQAQRLLALCCTFDVTPRSLDALFRKARISAGLKGFTFHDSRAFALTLLSRRVDAMTLARISGHRDLAQLLNTYYRESAASIAGRM
jgi:integrase